MTPIPADAGAPPPAPPAAPGAPEAPEASGAPGAPGAEAQPPPGTQTREELLFYAPDYQCLTIAAIILFPPLGIPALVFSGKVNQYLNLVASCPLPAPLLSSTCPLAVPIASAPVLGYG